ncbi:hypothetical protein [Microlunatus sp. Gsoil 973]|jgi:hypothetical protein|uniref:hypothetical protein n=1 Tax=Microlunatus sp. Gsoil 973 TaxID=2672569 RepID=UPI0012B4DD11|nr:hypothetical protein [Microlunatus sp. Gsoil 973]QGN34114.1 hypothetical protein GJV80_16250 [Microlunatus sp. Gsoil 973]
MIDWVSLIIVGVVSIGVTALFAVLLSVGIRLLSVARAAADSRAAMPATVGAWVLLGLIGVMLLLGLYLIIPQFH